MLPKLTSTIFLAVSTTVLMLVLNSCTSSLGDSGNGGGIGSSGMVDGGSATNGGGIGGSGYVDVAIGDITDFSSVVVNGVAYDTSEAAFTVNGMPAEQDDLRVGMNVTATVNFQSLAAGSISYSPIVLGPVSTTSLSERKFEVLGQTVVVDSSTELQGVSLESNASEVIAEGAIVEVSGIRNANNEVVATYIRRADSAESYLLQGLIESGVSDESKLVINGVSVDVSGIDPAQFNVGANEGDIIVLSLSPTASQATALAGSSILSIPSLNELLTTLGGTKIRVEGYISGNVFNAIFTLGDLQVFVAEETVFRFADGSAATANDLGANSRIELIATTRGIGVVVPDEIIIIER